MSLEIAAFVALSLSLIVGAGSAWVALQRVTAKRRPPSGPAPADPSASPAAARGPGQVTVASGLTLAEAEDLLDCLENQGCTRLEALLAEDGRVTVCWQFHFSLSQTEARQGRFTELGTPAGSACLFSGPGEAPQTGATSQG